MNPLNSPPPIPNPDGHVYSPPISTIQGGDWQEAPVIVKSWAYTLTWLGIIGTVLFMLFILMADALPPAQKIGRSIFYLCLLGANIWLQGAFKRGEPIAWKLQIVFSALGLLAIPVGTIIHGYILSKWFKPETKAWFGLS